MRSGISCVTLSSRKGQRYRDRVGRGGELGLAADLGHLGGRHGLTLRCAASRRWTSTASLRSGGPSTTHGRLQPVRRLPGPALARLDFLREPAEGHPFERSSPRLTEARAGLSPQRPGVGGSRDSCAPDTDGRARVISTSPDRGSDGSGLHDKDHMRTSVLLLDEPTSAGNFSCGRKGRPRRNAAQYSPVSIRSEPSYSLSSPSTRWSATCGCLSR
jgi:hypothetical protein